ncbi:DUF3953 domain-containing protein [Rossellomorea vietnamensis]|uniref:DUF3953 domain-containing protein n=1 Tax=Rossellomorea vietnamensis TaxID=218284 RepID=A0A5D4MHW3_9BACI|nr:DUF3953 domain-containing protein [Rossellomorea vietnamensis]TYS01158.1 DUF3953 domain-containing protein [Rossellomorea vietnamensis]
MKVSVENRRSLVIISLKIFFLFLTLILSAVLFFTQNIGLLGYSSMASGLFLILISVEELQRERKGSAIYVFGGSLFILLVSAFIFLL